MIMTDVLTFADYMTQDSLYSERSTGMGIRAVGTYNYLQLVAERLRLETQPYVCISHWLQVAIAALSHRLTH